MHLAIDRLMDVGFQNSSISLWVMLELGLAPESAMKTFAASFSVSADEQASCQNNPLPRQ